jgi:cytochrome oxidase Cu insertion factor (SCO1/SenC/PrrC family)
VPKSLLARAVALVSAAIALGLVLAVAVTLWRERDRPAVDSTDKGATGAALIGGPFELTDQHGNRVSDRDFRGRFMLVYFGYSFCPDVCPTDLAAMSTAVDQLGAVGEEVQPIFITIDPERDTVQRLADYAPLFHPRLIALTGTPEEIRQAAAAYRVYYEKAGEGRDYLMNHSGIIYLMDRGGSFITHFPQGTPAEEIADKIRARWALGDSGSS